MKTIYTYTLSHRFALLLALAVLTMGAWSMQAQSGARHLEHEVSGGETVYSLAKHYGVSTEAIYQLNPTAREGIRAGQVLRIPRANVGQTPQGSGITPQTKIHTIAAGETLYRISKLYGVTEEDISRANPGISATYFPQGYPLRIPSTTSRAQGNELGQGEEGAPEETLRPAVNVCLILPIGEGGRYVEFYEGLLMGLNDLKKDRVSVNLDVYDASSQEDVQSLIRRGALEGSDLVIGGKDLDQVQLLSGHHRRGVYISPFISSHDVYDPQQPLVHINQSMVSVRTSAVHAFIERYKGRMVYFVTRQGDREDAFAQELRHRLVDLGLGYRTVRIDRDQLNVEPSAVVVPISAEASLARQTLRAMQGLRSATLFGYPQWQSYGQSFLEELAKWDTTIFSSFFFDATGAEERQFMLQYNAWFSKKVSDTYPKYSVLGYDLARYMIRSYSQYRHRFLEMANYLPSDGLQMDIRPTRGTEDYVWFNTSFYFITFSSDGRIYKTTL